MQDLNQNQPNPGDNKNLIIFMVISALLYFTYDHFVLKPHEMAMRQARFETAKEKLLTAQEAEKQQALTTPSSSATSATAEATQEKPAPKLLIDNDHIYGELSLRGAKLDTWKLKDYSVALDNDDPVQILSPKGSIFPRGIEYGWVSSDTAIKLPNAKTLWSIKNGATTLTTNSPVTLTWNNGQGLRFERVLTLDDRYGLTVEQRVINTTKNAVTLYPYGLIAQTGVAPTFEHRAISHEGPIGYIGDELQSPKYKEMRKKKTINFQADRGWLGITDKYWLNAIVPPQGQTVKYRFTHTGPTPHKREKDMGRYQTDFTGAALTLAPGQSGSVTSSVFSGPKRLLLLKDYSKS